MGLNDSKISLDLSWESFCEDLNSDLAFIICTAAAKDDLARLG
jgi:hypothetical protein